MIEMYTAFFMLVVFMLLATAFTAINIHIGQAKTLYNSLKAEVQASNGMYVPDSATPGSAVPFGHSFEENGYTFRDDGFEMAYYITREYDSNNDITNYNETWIYNDTYKLTMIYVYHVPFFGRQIYPISGYVY